MKQLDLNKATPKKRTLVTYSNPDCMISEQFRMIQANIKFSVKGDKNSLFLITSPNSGEGKSTTAANLAISMAQQGDSVLLMDANLRNPTIHSFFKIPNSKGMSDVLTGRLSFDNAISRTEIGRLDILTSGMATLNPVELLGSEMMEELLIIAKSSYDIVLIDSHSVLEVTDTKLFASQCDGVILIIQTGKTKQQKAAIAKKELEFSKARLIGFILNE